LGDAKAVGRRDHRGEAAAAVFADTFAGEEQAVRRALPASDAAAKLVELGEAKAVGVVDDHDGRGRYVDTDLDHRGRDQHVELALLERAHRAIARLAV